MDKVQKIDKCQCLIWMLLLALSMKTETEVFNYSCLFFVNKTPFMCLHCVDKTVRGSTRLSYMEITT